MTLSLPTTQDATTISTTRTPVKTSRPTKKTVLSPPTSGRRVPVLISTLKTSLTISFVLVFHMVQKVCHLHLYSVLRAFLTSSTVSDDEHTSGTSSSDPSQERGLAFGWSLVCRVIRKCSLLTQSHINLKLATDSASCKLSGPITSSNYSSMTCDFTGS
jgi:hypothetical protein